MQGWSVSYETDNVGIQESVNLDHISVYPNPASDKLNINFNSAEKQDIQVQLMSITGEIIYSDIVNNFSGDYFKSLDVSRYAKGMYFLRIKTKGGEMNKKIVVQ